ncbi:MAG: hypothetical protein ABI682_06445 [Acidobacteriota bacterium]
MPLNDAPDLVLTCPICGKDIPVSEALDVDVWHTVDCTGSSVLLTDDHYYWWRRRSNPVPGEEPLLEYSAFDPDATADPKTAH